MNKVARWSFTALRFAVFYTGEVVRSNLRVAADVLAPQPHISPGVVTLPVEDLTDRQAWLLACLLTMTPGTLTLDVRGAPRELYLHTLYKDEDAAAFRARILQDYVTPIRNLF